MCKRSRTIIFVVAISLGLLPAFGCATKVKLQTNMGDIVIELDEKAAPVTVSNFLQYVEDDFYDGCIFHRVIPDFMIQGGGFTPDLRRKAVRKPIVNEAQDGLANVRGTIAMARKDDPASATSQFFINQKDNPSLNYLNPRKAGYTVFGRVVAGMDVVDAIAHVPTTTQGGLKNVPIAPVIILYAEVISK